MTSDLKMKILYWRKQAFFEQKIIVLKPSHGKIRQKYLDYSTEVQDGNRKCMIIFDCK